ncbi:hypothetical protein BD769DRAFT_1412798 [Suillus cothurnatus]|nr:hypothetical protein BD769DRAFT_1412798 [Suillus cothurnatus]
MIIYLRTGPRVLHSPLTNFTVLVLCVRITLECSSVLCTTMSSPNHIMSSFSQAGSGTTHTTANSPNIFAAFVLV